MLIFNTVEKAVVCLRKRWEWQRFILRMKYLQRRKRKASALREDAERRDQAEERTNNNVL